MEQIQIRQPKMPAAQSFIQILETFLAKMFIFMAAYISYIKNSLFNKKTAKALGNTRFSIINANLIYQREICQRIIKLKIWSIYYVLLISKYISLSSHEKAWFLFWNQEKSGFLPIKLSLKSFNALGKWIEKF